MATIVKIFKASTLWYIKTDTDLVSCGPDFGMALEGQECGPDGSIVELAARDKDYDEVCKAVRVLNNFAFRHKRKLGMIDFRND